ncbi:polyketide synthase [Zymobacter palmae]|nr:type I polyketide synthase [Zymobacter palmae]
MSSRSMDQIDELIAQHFPDSDPIAVIGYACRFPCSPDSTAFWHNIVDGQECSRHFSHQEMREAGVPDEVIDAPDFVNVGAVLEDADRFDATLFGYSRQEAESIDPQQRLFLQNAWHALEHAGYAPRQVPHRTGVFASSRISTYPGRAQVDVTEVAQVKGLQSLMGNDKDYVASRVAYKLDLHGPALAVQTACSSSLVAAHLACESLRSGESDMAIAGGVALAFPQQAGYRYQPGMIFSPDGRCRPFDAEAQGTFAGNGVGAIVLRRLRDALHDGDPIAAVVLGSAINNDGERKVGYTAPSVAGQQAVIEEALQLAGIGGQQIGMIEAHGTGTPLGDPIELKALCAAFGDTGQPAHCALGSIKGNFGHMDTAAGVASLLKTVLAVEHGTLPPTLNVQKPNPALALDESPFRLLTCAQDWGASLRYAGVSSFGIGGTNCHMIVASLPEALRQTAPSSSPSTPAQLCPPLLLSAASDTALHTLATRYADALREPSSPEALAATALHGRQLDLPYRLALTVDQHTPEALKNWSEGAADERIHCGSGTFGRQAWLFTGQGAQWPGMAAAMYAFSPVFAEQLDTCIAACHDQAPALREALLEADSTWLDSMAYTQPALVAFEIAMAAHWQSLGLAPERVIGHSVGEFAAAVVAGHYTAAQIMPLVCQRGALMQQCAPGSMIAVFAEAERIAPLAEAYGLDLAADNGVQHHVYSGTTAAVDTFQRALFEQDILYKRLPVTGAAHSALMDPIMADFQAACDALPPASPGRVPLISTLNATLVDATDLTAEHWARHLRHPVRFQQALELAQQQNVRVFLEVGPDATLSTLGKRETDSQECTWIASQHRAAADELPLRTALMQLYAAGCPLPWTSLFGDTPLPRCRAPLYPFDRKRYWCETESRAVSAASSYATCAVEAGQRVAMKEAGSLSLSRLHTLYDCVTELHALYVDQLVRRCVGDRIDHDEGVDALSILRAGRLLPRYRQLLTRLLNSGVEDGYYTCLNGTHYRTVRRVEADSKVTLLDTLTDCCEGLEAIPRTVAHAGDNLYAMMSGGIDPVAIIFPQGSSSGVEVLYQEFSFGRYFNQIAAGVLEGIVASRPTDKPLRILEVGGGTGGTTAWLLPVLKAHPHVDYTFTDISLLFTHRAQEKFADYDFMHYRAFDLHTPALAQGFTPQHYDVIIAANVIHATQHVGKTLSNLRTVLKPSGQLVMREITQPMRLFDFVFGPLVQPLLDYEARQQELFLSTSQWKQQCHEAGFSRVDWLPLDGGPTSEMSEHVIVATPTDMPLSSSSSTLPSIDAETDDPILGQRLSVDGTYQADWHECAADPERWNAYWCHAWQTLSERHGQGQSTPPAPPCAAPATLSWVRLHWQATPFAHGALQIEALTNNRFWQPLTQACALALSPAPETHYQWHWHTQPFPTAHGEATYRVLNEKAIAHLSLSEPPPLADDAPTLLFIAEDPCSTLSALVHDVLAALTQHDEDLIVVTHNGWRIHPTDGAALSPEHHALWALLRVAANEQPERLIAAVDLSDTRDDALLPAALAAISPNQRWLALREGHLFSEELNACQHTAPPLPEDAFSADQWHVVTGAFGGLGRLTVRWLHARGARHIALLAPRADEAWLAQCRSAMGDDTELRWCACDVSDAAELAQVMETLACERDIAGAVHAAGQLDDGLLPQLSEQRLTHVLAVKATAAAQLQEWLAAHGSRYLVLYSSAAAALGARGQGAHALACGYLDGLAQRTLSSPLCTLSIAWGAWGESGRAADPALLAMLAEDGMDALTDAEGLWHLEQAIMRNCPYRLAMRVRPQRMPPIQQALLYPPSGEDAPTDKDRPRRSSSSTLATPSASFTGRRDDVDDIITWLKQRVVAQLRIEDPEQLQPEQDLLQIGMDSLLFLELSSDIQRQLGIRLDAEAAWQNMSIAGLARTLCADSHETTLPDALPAELHHDEEHRYDPFPLTPIQHAYWLGRTQAIQYGGVACHVVFEWDKRHDEFDISRLEEAWNQLIERHDMLRMVIDDDGRQRILYDTPRYRIRHHDLRTLTPAQREEALTETRQALSYQVLRTDQWPLFELFVSDLDAEHYRLHMNLDLLLFDVQSFKVMMDDLAATWHGTALPAPAITFRDYVMAEQAHRQTTVWHDAWEYWQDILPMLPPAPALPTADTPPDTPRFITYQSRLEPQAWSALKQRWQQAGITPSAALLTLFAATLERWSRHPAFTLNLTFFNRRPLHPDIDRIIGDFTAVTLVDFDFSAERPLSERMQQTQQRLWQHMAHSDVNGVEVIRELGRLRGQQRQPLMPVVFTSMLGMSLEGLSIEQAMTRLLGDPCHVFTQTPQVWLDHQVMESEGALIFSWYCMEDVLTPGTARDMFDDYCAVLAAYATPGEEESPQLQRLLAGQSTPFPRQRWPLPATDAFDLRDIEQFTQAQPHVKQARAEQQPDGTLRLTVTGRHEALPSAALPPDSPLTTLALPPLTADEQHDLDATWAWLEARALHGMAETLLRHSLFVQVGDHHALEDVMTALGAQPQYQRLVRQWLRHLHEKGVLDPQQEGWTCVSPLQNILAPQSQRPSSDWGKTLADYLDNCVAQHDALFSGECSPLGLLFDAQDSVADAFYCLNPASRCLNEQAARIMDRLAAETPSLNVLEVGAGTAATSRHLLATPHSKGIHYRFTDLSVQFLNDAAARFGDDPRLSYGLLDINQPAVFDDHPDGGYDLIVAVNVLHDASHVPHTLQRLRLLLAPGGRLLMIEATERDSSLQRASIGFIEGLSGYRDARLRDDKPMLSAEGWQSALQQTGWVPELIWPSATAPSSLRQHLIVARHPGHHRPACDEIEHALRQQFGEALPTLAVRYQEDIHTPSSCASPSTDALPLATSTEAPSHGDAQRQTIHAPTALEQQVAALWKTLLSRPVTHDSDFFQLGGDSLIATRMVAQLNQRGIGQVRLQDLFEHAQLADFCRCITPPEVNDATPLVPLASSAQQPTLFVFHASDGDVSSLLPLARQLNGQVFGLQAVEPQRHNTLRALTEAYVQAITRQQPHGPYTLVGWSYGTFLAAEAAHLLHAQGHVVRLALIDPVCQCDFQCENRAELFALLSQSDAAWTLPDMWDCLSDDEQMAQLVQRGTAAGWLPAHMQEEEARQWLNRVQHLLSLLAHHPLREPLAAPCLILTAAHRPAHWTPADRVWRAWLDNAHCHTLDADHWQLMLDTSGTAECAHRIHQWLTHLPETLS